MSYWFLAWFTVWWLISKLYRKLQKTDKGQTQLTGIDLLNLVAANNQEDIKIGIANRNAYSAETGMILLQPEVATGNSPSVLAIAAHEAGHFFQHRKNPSWMVAVNRFIKWQPFLLVLCVINPRLGIPLYGLYGLVILGIEFDASRRGFALLSRYVPKTLARAVTMWTLAWFTYVTTIVSEITLCLIVHNWIRG